MSDWSSDVFSSDLITWLNLYVAETRSEAQDMYDELNEGILPEIGIKALEKHLEMDLSGVNLDGPLPPVKESELTSNAIKLAIVHMAQRENLTVRQLYKRVYGYSNHVVIRSEEHTSELQSLMRISYAVFCLKKKRKKNTNEKTRKNQQN